MQTQTTSNEQATSFLRLLEPADTAFCFSWYREKGVSGPYDPALEGFFEQYPRSYCIEQPDSDLLDVLQCINREAFAIYVCMNPLQKVGGKVRREDANVTRVRSVFGDFDNGLPERPFPVKPTCVVNTSKGKYQAFWRVEGVSVEDFNAIERRLVQDWGADPNAVNRSRIFRLPGFLHQKNGGSQLVTIHSRNDVTYSRDEILNAFPAIEKPLSKPTPNTSQSMKAGVDAGSQDTERIASALAAVPVDIGASGNRLHWLRIGAALFHGFEGNDQGKALWDEWSRSSRFYDRSEINKTWPTLARESADNANLGTIVHLARENGWQGGASLAKFIKSFTNDKRISHDSQDAELDAGPDDDVIDRECEQQLGVQVEWFDQVEFKPIDWLWEKHIMRGNLNLIVGHPAQGKSTVTCDMAARVTMGLPWPTEDQAAPKRKPGRVVFVNDEDNAADTIGPRLLAAGADITRVGRIVSVKKEVRKGEVRECVLSLLDDIPQLEELLLKHRDIQLIIVDPINSYLRGVDTHNNAEMRSALTPLKKLAETYNVAVVLVAHLNKSGDGPALNRISGSNALGAASRAAFAIGKHPDTDDPDLKVMVPLKQNLTRATKAIAFRTVSRSVSTPSGAVEVPKAEWCGSVDDVSASDVLSGSDDRKKPSALDGAKDWLLARLKPGHPVGVDELKEEAKGDGYSWATLRRAKEMLRVEARRSGFGDGGEWAWVMPIPGMADGIGGEGSSLVPLKIDLSKVGARATELMKRERKKSAAADAIGQAEKKFPHLKRQKRARAKSSEH